MREPLFFFVRIALARAGVFLFFASGGLNAPAKAAAANKKNKKPRKKSKNREKKNKSRSRVDVFRARAALSKDSLEYIIYILTFGRF